ncbi:hypothetical protein FHR90_002978 [Endobacter medicaginis]|uniref:Uncharacterized protein n=1 Tax=Endobacter medicaginis TaxID=1181271 RepID=A0A850NQT5_9PROT|nr:hypothetical protein [Endobacter medicaginis]MBB3175129.1 hypothetical protein [Endobacter medicaginis]MCX5476444.1 hypothetical protein [Endobacter medicaginis]NVN31264.1 hypothetical protein [Endobacter medicaginis]
MWLLVISKAEDDSDRAMAAGLQIDIEEVMLFTCGSIGSWLFSICQ